MDSNLIMDFGMHDGADTDFYLRKGFRVVAVEADPVMAEQTAARFKEAIAAGRLTIVNKAISHSPGVVTLYRAQNSLWSTISEPNSRTANFKGSSTIEVEVEATTSQAIVEEYGTPYYLKIDIEGYDMVALKGLENCREMPRYISIESARSDLPAVRSEIEQFQKLGYKTFKVVAQHRVSQQKEPSPPREGKAAGNPVHESSGLFGRDLPGRWLGPDEAVDAYRRPLFNHHLIGTGGLVKNRYLRAALKRTGFRPGWYDTHASLD